jgi:hypothetical protein
MPGSVRDRCNLHRHRPRSFVSEPQRLANGLFLENRCALPDQTSLFSASDGRAFVLANGDWDGADKREIAILVFGITANDSSHGTLLNGKVVRSPRRTSWPARALRCSSNRPPHRLQSRALMMRAWLPNSSVYQLLTIMLILRLVAPLASRESVAFWCRRRASSFNLVRMLVSWSMPSPPQSIRQPIVGPNDGRILSFVRSKEGGGLGRS